MNFPFGCTMLTSVPNEQCKNRSTDIKHLISVKMASQNGNREEFVEGWTLAQTLGEGAYGE